MPVATLDNRSTRNRRAPGLADAPFVVVLGGISATRDVNAWWPSIVGDHAPIDTRVFQVAGIDWQDGGRGEDGRPKRIVTTHDQADRLAAMLDSLGIESLHAIVGASYGGMVALAFADRYPTRVEQLVVISAPAETHPMSTALRSVQRRVVELGLETNRATDALSIARGLATITYRSAAEFAQRFESAPVTLTSAGAEFPVESYLKHQGEKFARSFAPERFLALSLSADLHRVTPENISTPAVFVGARTDTIVPIAQLDDLAARWGGFSRLVEIPARTGHDAFLAEPELVGPVINEAISQRIPA